jgi:hypothetical protein
MSGNKFSVIIPTMWYSDKIYRNLLNLNNCQEVGEIVLIDNNTSLKPSYLDSITKLVHLPQEKNLFVNPAWNLGVKTTQYQNLCISNDDIEFNTDIFQWMLNYIDVGVTGMWTGNYYKENGDKPYEREPIVGRPWGWGCLYFIHKDNWVEIDERLKIACGDDFLIRFVKGGGYMIKNMDLDHDDISITSRRGEFFGQQQEDIKLWESQY